MTELDTAALRAEYCQAPYDTDRDIVKQLCDALDAARMDTRDMDEYDARWFALHHELDAAERSVSRWVDIAERAEARAEAAEENLAFAQQRAADNGLRAEIGEGKIRELVAEVRDLRGRIADAAALCIEAAPYGHIHTVLTA